MFLLQFIDIGIVTSIEINHKQVDVAKKGQEVCVKIEPIPGEAPKMFGRHFEATDILVSKVGAYVVGGMGSHSSKDSVTCCGHQGATLCVHLAASGGAPAAPFPEKE